MIELCKQQFVEKIGDVIMALGFKKEYKEFYMPKNEPSIIESPKMNYIAARGTGRRNGHI